MAQNLRRVFLSEGPEYHSKKKIIVNQQAKSIELNGDLYMDAKNTQPFIELVPDSYIVWNGEKIRVSAVTGVYDSDKLHHYKIKLSNWS